MDLSKSRFSVMLIAFSIIVGGAVIGLYTNDAVLMNGRTVQFTDPATGDNLVGTYYPGDQPAGIILFHGFSSDQGMMRGIAAEFAEWGIHVFTVDFSGHGRSDGTIGFDNAQSDRLAYQALAVKEYFKSLSGLADIQIIMMGHSMGARTALWASTLDPTPVAGLILLGCSVSLLPSDQAGFFTGTDDNNLLWVQNLNATNPATDILLITGGWDDILPPNAAEALLIQLQRNASLPGAFNRELAVVPRVFHNYEIYSPRIIGIAKSWASTQLNPFLSHAVSVAPFRMQIRILCWALFLIGLFLALIVGSLYVKTSPKSTTDPAKKTHGQELPVQIEDRKHFFKAKIIYWLSALPVLTGISLIFALIPIGLPVFNIIYVGFIASYGLVLAWHYARGKMPGVPGAWAPWRIGSQKSNMTNMPNKNTLLATGFSILMILICGAFMASGIGYVWVTNGRLVWLVIFTALSAIGFYIGQQELMLVRQLDTRSNKYAWSIIAINFLPFFLSILLFLMLRSASGLLGALQGIFILLVSVLAGEIVEEIAEKPWLTAIFQAFFLQFMILPQGALFKIF